MTITMFQSQTSREWTRGEDVNVEETLTNTFLHLLIDEHQVQQNSFTLSFTDFMHTKPA